MFCFLNRGRNSTLSPQSADVFPKKGLWIGEIHCSSVLILLAPWGFFCSFLLSESFGGALILPVFVLDSAWTWRTCEHFIHEEQFWNPTRVWLCNGQSHAMISSIVMKSLLTLRLTPHVLVQPHSPMGDTPYMWNRSGVKLHSIFSQWDISIRRVSEHMSRMCAYLRRLRYCTNEYSPEGNRCRKAKVWYDIHQNTPFML